MYFEKKDSEMTIVKPISQWGKGTVIITLPRYRLCSGRSNNRLIIGENPSQKNKTRNHINAVIHAKLTLLPICKWVEPEEATANRESSIHRLAMLEMFHDNHQLYYSRYFLILAESGESDVLQGQDRERTCNSLEDTSIGIGFLMCSCISLPITPAIVLLASFEEDDACRQI
jgi:hypothetical protein